MVKPDLEIFEEVATRLEVPAHRILFLDDNTLNVDAAGAAGFVSVRAQGVEEARNALVEAGILEG
jgi:putative hydrolase of the HAD superfamily